jgi:hypothetical protein
VHRPEPVTFSFPSGRMNVAALIVEAYDNAAPEAMRSSPARQGHRRCD